MSDKYSELRKHGFAYDPKSVIHPKGYEDQFKPQVEEMTETAEAAK